MKKKVVAVYTFKSVETIKAVGGSESWKLDPERAAACTYAVICRNAQSPHVQGDEKHGHAFMIGKIKDVVPSTDTAGRWLIRFSEFAVGDFGKQWEGRNPVAYYSVDDYSGGEDFPPIDFDDLTFQPMPEEEEDVGEDAPISHRSLNIAEAKAGLATFYGVNPVNVEICIRG